MLFNIWSINPKFFLLFFMMTTLIFCPVGQQSQFMSYEIHFLWVINMLSYPFDWPFHADYIEHGFYYQIYIS